MFANALGTPVWGGATSARYAARNVNCVLVVREPHNGLGAPQARPPARSGDRGTPPFDSRSGRPERSRGARARAWGGGGGEAPGSGCHDLGGDVGLQLS